MTKIIGLTDEGADKALTPVEARLASGTFTHYFSDTPPTNQQNFDRWTDENSGITYTWFYGTWVEFGTGYSGLGPPTAPVNINLPTVVGASNPDDTATVIPGEWDGDYVLTYQWQELISSTWVDIPGETGTTFVPTEAGTYRVNETATNDVGSTTVSSLQFVITEPSSGGLTFGGAVSPSAVLSENDTKVSSGANEYAVAWVTEPFTTKVYLETFVEISSEEATIVFTGDGMSPITEDSNPVVEWNTPRAWLAPGFWDIHVRANYGMTTNEVSTSLVTHSSSQSTILLRVAIDPTTRQVWATFNDEPFDGNPALGTGETFTLNGSSPILLGATVGSGDTVKLMSPEDHVQPPPAGFTAV